VRPFVLDAAALEFHRITPDDPVRVAVLAGPESSPVTVMLEAWDPGGAQPPNTHPRSIETCVFLRGNGFAVCDEHEVNVRAGDTIVLPAGTVHHIHNEGAGRLYSLTLMCPDEGFADLVRRGPVVPTDDEDRAVFKAIPR